MQYLCVFFAFFISFILQSTVLSSMAIFGVAPNLILVLVVAISFFFKEKYGLIYGVIFGFIYDLSFGTTIGANALTYLLIAYFIIEIKRYIYQDNIFTISVISIISVAGYYIIFWCIIVLFGSNYSFLLMLKMLPVGIVYNSILIFLVIRLIEKRICRGTYG